MTIQSIEKAPRKKRIEAIQGKRTFEEIDRLDNIARDVWASLYTAAQTGERDYIYWNDAPIIAQSDIKSHLCHVLTRSTKQANALQLTCIQIKNGEPIPLSDLQITEPEQFIKETPNTAKVYIFKKSQRRQCAGIGLLVFMRISTHTIKDGKIHAAYLQT